MTTEQKIRIDDLAREQAILAHANEIDMDDQDAMRINRASLPTREAQILFKHSFRRHARNIAEGNPFYGCTE
jgi:hypothetical protein